MQMSIIELRICMYLDCKGRIDKITQILNYLNQNGFLTNLVLMYDDAIRAENIEEMPDLPSLTIDIRDDKLRFKYFNGSRTLWLFHTDDLFKALLEGRKEYEEVVDKYRPVTQVLLDVQSDYKTSIKRVSYRFYPNLYTEVAYDLLFSSQIKEQAMESELLTEINNRLSQLEEKDLKFSINFDFEDRKCTACEKNEKRNREI